MAVIEEMKTTEFIGLARIDAERRRQVREEWFNAVHDDGDEHALGEMIHAAVCYAELARLQGLGLSLHDARGNGFVARAWPWAFNLFKPVEDEIRNLVKAGALIAAEIDRLERLRARGPDP